MDICRHKEALHDLPELAGQDVCLPLIGLGAIVLAACGSTSNAATGPKVTKTTATFAEGPGAQPNYILPLASLQYFSVSNLSQFQFLMYRPLYWFGDNGQVLLNNSLSLADPPVYSSDGKSVTITLKGWKWSDGTQITARDIQFWQNLVTANKDDWAGYSPGEYPDNVLSTTISPTNPLQITFNLSQAYGSYFFTYNELSQITPLPQHVWDKESATGAVGNYDETPAGAQAVFKFLDAQSKSISTYDTNPLWQVVSGPWKLKSMDTAGNVSMVPNPGYGGPVKPTLTQFNEVPFTKDTAEFDELKSATSPTERDSRLRLPAREQRAGAVDARQRLQLRALDGLAGHVFPGELHQPDQRTDLQPAVLQTGDAGPGRSEHLHRQGVLRIRLSDVRPGADQAILELRRFVREEQSIPV